MTIPLFVLSGIIVIRVCRVMRVRLLLIVTSSICVRRARIVLNVIRDIIVLIRSRDIRVMCVFLLFLLMFVFFWL